MRPVLVANLLYVDDVGQLGAAPHVRLVRARQIVGVLDACSGVGIFYGGESAGLGYGML